MPTFGRTGHGKWHVVGPDGCRHGRAFAADPDSDLDQTVTATDIVAYDPPDSADEARSGEVTAGFSRRISRNSLRSQRLVLPREIRESDSELCNSCRSRLETHQKRRARVITEFKHVTPLRDIDWTSTEYESLGVCYWCHAHESTLWASEALGSRVCPVCSRLFNSQLGEPSPEIRPRGTSGQPLLPSS